MHELHVPPGKYPSVVCVVGIDRVSGAFDRARPWRTVAISLPNCGVAVVWLLNRIRIDLMIVVPVDRGIRPSVERSWLLLGWLGAVLLRARNLLLVRRCVLLRLSVVRLDRLGLLGLLGVSTDRSCNKDDPQCTMLHDFLPPRAAFLPA